VGPELLNSVERLPLLILVAWTTKAFSPDLSTKSALTARDLDFRLELVSSGAALWKQLLLPLFTAACILFVIRWRHLFRAYISVLFPIGLLGAFLLASIFWSDHPDDTARRAIRQIFLFTSVAGAVVIGRSKNRFVTYFQTTSLILLVYESLFLLVPWISFDVFGKFTGIHATKNELGGIAVALWLMIIVVIPMALLGFGEAPIDFYRSILPEEALTGRTGIWYHLLADLKKNWMFGTAYGAYWGVGDIPEALDIKYSW